MVNRPFASLPLGSRLTIVGGKGGVGKTTTAAALALALAEQGREVVVLSVDPAHSLGDALEMVLDGEPRAVPGVPRLRALEVDPSRERERVLGAGRAPLISLLDRGTFLDTEDVAGLIDLAIPGIDELAAVFRILDLSSRANAHLVVDTAPTGHTLRLLEVPRLARAWLGSLERMEEKNRAVSVALTGAYQPDAAVRFLRSTAADLDGFSSLLVDPTLTRFVLVTVPEPVVLAETSRYAAALADRGIALAGTVVNRAAGTFASGTAGEWSLFVPELVEDPRGLEGLRRFAAGASFAPRAAHSSPPAPVLAGAHGERASIPFRPPLDRSLYFVGGKGGVGKSTTSAALALFLAERRRGPVLLLSIDPAGSLGDVLGQEVGAVPRAVEAAPSLHVQQLDATRAWAAFRRRYREEAGELFDLAPPGVNELMALLEVVDAMEDRRYDPLVVDTAPTGHLLRLLELPDLALEWCHAVLRLLLKYREVVRMEPLAERILRLARALRSFRQRLEDPAATWFLVVARPESLAVPETRRLLAGLHRLHMTAGALLVNGMRESGVEPYATALLDAAGAVPCAAAPALPAGPRGVLELRGFGASWREMPSPANQTD